MERADFDQWKSREVARLLALVESERRYYQEMVATLPVPLAVLSADRSVISANRAFRQLFELRGADLRRQNVDQLLAIPDLTARIQEAHGLVPHAPSAPAAPLVVKLDAKLRAQSGERTVRISVAPIRDWNDENALETLLVVEDLSGAAAAAPDTLAVVAANLPAVVWQADAETLQFGSVSTSGDAAGGTATDALLGYPAEHWIGTPGFFEERIYSEDRPAAMALYRAAIQNGGDASAEFRAVAADGAMVWCRESIRAAAPAQAGATASRSITGVITNIDRRKEIENQLLTASRTEALQTLAGRLAHDLNNPLMIITGYAEEMLASFAPDDPRRADVGQILSASGRVGEVTRQLVEFGHKQAHPPAPVSLSQVVRAAEPAIRRAAGPGVSIETIAPKTDLWTSANADQLGDVIVALAGAHAGSQDRTRLTVSWDADTLSESVASSIAQATLKPGRYVRITLRDDGCGLSPALRASFFEGVLAPRDAPKDAGSPGPGPRPDLARAYQMVREWGGDIAVETGFGLGGNTYSIYLPYLDAPSVTVETPPALPVAPAPPPVQTRETILVVDDEAGIRGLMRKILRRERYVVLEAGSGEEALAVALSHAGPIDLLLTDVMMPGLNGPELARRMCDATPALKVLLISGYAPEEVLPSAAQPSDAQPQPTGFAFLSKPFTLGALVSKVRETLDS